MRSQLGGNAVLSHTKIHTNKLSERAVYHELVDLYLDRLEPAKIDLALIKLYRALRRVAEQDNVTIEALEQEAEKRKKKDH